MRYTVTVYVQSPYYTIVEAESEEEAIERALERDGPSIPASLEMQSDYEWVADHLLEFPNLGTKQVPEVELTDE